MNQAKERKSEIRERIAAFRRDLDPGQQQRHAAGAAATLFELPSLQSLQGKTVALYLPLRDELDTEPIWAGLRSRGARSVFPQVRKGEPALTFSPLAPEAPIRHGPLGVREPLAGEEIRLEEIDVFLVPGVAFDEEGGRLGRGAGYYDATLAQAPRALRIGLCFDEQVIADVPMLSHDLPMDWIVTPTRRIRCPGR